MELNLKYTRETVITDLKKILATHNLSLCEESLLDNIISNSIETSTLGLKCILDTFLSCTFEINFAEYVYNSQMCPTCCD